AVIRATPARTGVSHLRRKYGQPLQILVAIAGLVLAIACANIANLLLARATVRQREVSVRLAVGATRGRLLRQLLTESVLLSLLGGVAGVLLAFLATSELLTMVFPGAATFAFEVTPDVRVLGFAAGVSVLAGVLFGIAPALRASRLDLVTAMKSGSRTAGADSRGRFSAGKLLVVAQVALSLLLVVGAGLFVRSLVKLAHQDFGFSPEHVLLVKVDPRIAGYKPAQLAGLYQRIQQAVNAQPGVRSSALALYTPLSGDNWDGNISIDKNTPEENKHLGSAWVRVTPGYFETMGMPLLLGRGFTEQDTADGTHAVVVNETFAHDFYGKENPIGHRFGRSEATKQQWEIVGVVKSTKHTDPRDAGEDTYFLPVQQLAAGASQDTGDLYLRDLVVRASGNPATIAEAVRQALRGVDDNIPVTRITTMTDQIDASFNQEQLIGVLSAIFGGLALLLACVGLYGLMAYAVARRTNEIGLRMALGASRETVLWMVLRESLVLVAIGVVVGLPLVVAGVRVVKSQLFGIAPYDPLALISALLVLVTIAAMSGFIPARRATRVEPMVALRDE
ncbi:MAG TPA: ABC transporter permease, partial [Terriglobales bacterium]|nr:ABC transporter permease [Terriglobales bacterium]